MYLMTRLFSMELVILRLLKMLTWAFPASIGEEDESWLRVLNCWLTSSVKVGRGFICGYTVEEIAAEHYSWAADGHQIIVLKLGGTLAVWNFAATMYNNRREIRANIFRIFSFVYLFPANFDCTSHNWHYLAIFNLSFFKLRPLPCLNVTANPGDHFEVTGLVLVKISYSKL